MRKLQAFAASAAVVAFCLHGDSARADDDATPSPTPNVIIVAPAASTPDPSAAPSNPASPSAPDPLSRPKVRRHWYGWQTLTFDGAAIVGGIGLGELGVKDPELFWLGTYALAPPVVHLAHGHVGIAFADLGLRVAAPTATTAIGYAVACKQNQSLDDLGTCIAGMGLGFLIGYGAAVAIDAAVLAREDVDVSPAKEDDEASRAFTHERQKRAAMPSVMPDIGVGENRASIGLRGTF